MNFWIYVLIIFIASFLLGLLYRRYKESLRLGRPFELAKTKRVMVSGTQVHYVQEGRGPDILLVHGIGASKYCWRFIFKALSKDFRVTALDLPGFGSSQKSIDLDYGLDGQTDRLAEFVEKLHLNPVHLVGNSMGGAICLWLARKFPQLVESITVISPAADAKIVPFNTERLLPLAKALGPLFLNKAAIKRIYKRVVSNPALITRESIDEYYRPYEKNQEALTTFWKAQNTLRDPRLPGQLNQLQTPVLVLYGEKDRQVKRQHIDNILLAVRHARLVLHPEGGHHLMEDDPDFVLDHIRKFVSERS